MYSVGDSRAVPHRILRLISTERNVSDREKMAPSYAGLADQRVAVPGDADLLAVQARIRGRSTRGEESGDYRSDRLS